VASPHQILQTLKTWQDAHGTIVSTASWSLKKGERPPVSKDLVYATFHSMRGLYKAMEDAGILSPEECLWAMKRMHWRKMNYDDLSTMETYKVRLRWRSRD